MKKHILGLSMFICCFGIGGLLTGFQRQPALAQPDHVLETFRHNGKTFRRSAIAYYEAEGGEISFRSHSGKQVALHIHNDATGSCFLEGLEED